MKQEFLREREASGYARRGIKRAPARLTRIGLVDSRF
jgi:hypothetical protein